MKTMASTHKFNSNHIVFALLAAIVVLFLVKNQPVQSPVLDSTKAAHIKKSLLRLADGLKQAENSGDKKTALDITMAVTNIINEFNDLPTDEKMKINSSNLRFCNLAQIQLSDAGQSIYAGKGWQDKADFYDTLKQCH